MSARNLKNGVTDEYEYLRMKLYNLAGINMPASKNHLIFSRLRSRVAHLNHSDLADYCEYLDSLSSNDPEWQIFLNLLTTNKTNFFREAKHYEYLIENFFPRLISTGRNYLRIWCAACSTGEEAYTLAMICHKHLPTGFDFKIVASDIDTAVVEIAANGVYPIQSLDEIPNFYRYQAIERGSKEIKDWFRIRSELKSKVDFRVFNLMSQSQVSSDIFDLVFCRNVLIYFDVASVHYVVNKIYKSVAKNGELFLGHSESLQGIDSSWNLVAPAVYRK